MQFVQVTCHITTTTHKPYIVQYRYPVPQVLTANTVQDAINGVPCKKTKAHCYYLTLFRPILSWTFVDGYHCESETLFFKYFEKKLGERLREMKGS
jgi:hypothetical protein